MVWLAISGAGAVWLAVWLVLEERDRRRRMRDVDLVMDEWRRLDHPGRPPMISPR